MMIRPLPQRGSVLVTAIVLLAVLTVIGVAAVRLGSQERMNAATRGKHEFSQACANAAVAKVWGEMSNYGLGYLGSGVKVTAMSLPDGTILTSPSHYGQPTGASAPLVRDVVLRVESLSSSQQAERDCTNKLCGPDDLGRSYSVTAHCKDARGREAEVELALKFAL
jgi:Tfp pilus assembly protein PilX